MLSVICAIFAARFVRLGLFSLSLERHFLTQSRLRTGNIDPRPLAGNGRDHNPSGGPTCGDPSKHRTTAELQRRDAELRSAVWYVVLIRCLRGFPGIKGVTAAQCVVATWEAVLDIDTLANEILH